MRPSRLSRRLLSREALRRKAAGKGAEDEVLHVGPLVLMELVGRLHKPRGKALNGAEA